MEDTLVDSLEKRIPGSSWPQQERYSLNSGQIVRLIMLVSESNTNQTAMMLPAKRLRSYWQPICLH